MPYYSFKISKFSISLEVQSSESDLISQEMDKWLADLLGIELETVVPATVVKQEPEKSEFIEIKVKPDVQSKEAEILETKTKGVETVVQNVVDTNSEIQEIVKIQESIAEPVYLAVNENLHKEMTEENILEETQINEDITTPVDILMPDIQNAENLLDKTEEDIAMEESSWQEISFGAESEDFEDDFEEISELYQEIPEEYSNKIENLDEIIIEEDIQTNIAEDTTLDQKEEKKSGNKFYEILQDKFSSVSGKKDKKISKATNDAFDALPEMRVLPAEMKNSPSEIDAPTEELNTLESLIQYKKPESLLEYLLVTAYYLTEIEKYDRYSLKQINAQVINYTRSPIDHSIVQKSVQQKYIEVVPDFTGMAGITEYRITDEGKAYLTGEVAAPNLD